MYHFYFNLPKNDKNAGTVFLPRKSSTGVPVIISCYGWNKIHWPIRVEEGLRDLAVGKRGMGMVTMALVGESDDPSPAVCDRWERNLADMVAWVRDKRYFDAARVGLFAYGMPAKAALRLADGDSGLAYVIINPAEPSESTPEETAIPVLTLHGTTDKIQIQSKPIKAEEVLRQGDAGSKTASITFKGGDYHLYNIVEQAAVEIVKWIDGA